MSSALLPVIHMLQNRAVARRNFEEGVTKASHGDIAVPLPLSNDTAQQYPTAKAVIQWIEQQVRHGAFSGVCNTNAAFVPSYLGTAGR